MEVMRTEGRDPTTSVPEFNRMLSNQLFRIGFCGVIIDAMGHVKAPHDASVVPEDQCPVAMHLEPSPIRVVPMLDVSDSRNFLITNWNLDEAFIPTCSPFATISPNLAPIAAPTRESLVRQFWDVTATRLLTQID